MAINVIVQYNGGFLPDILLLTQAPIVVWFHGTIIVCYSYQFNYVLRWLLFRFVWWPCMAINVSVQYNGGLLPGIILLTQGYYHRGTRSSATKRFCLCSLSNNNNFKHVLNDGTAPIVIKFDRTLLLLYIVINLLDDVLHCFCFVLFGVPPWRLM